MLVTRLFGLLSCSNFAMFLFWILLFCDLALRHPLVTVDSNRHRHGLGVRRPVNWQQRTPHPPNDWKKASHVQMAFAPIAICFQFVPSLTARHGTEPVPPALK